MPRRHYWETEKSKAKQRKKTLHQNVIERVEKNSNLKHSVRKFEANRIRLEDLSSNFAFYSNRRYMKPEKKANSLSAFLDFFPIWLDSLMAFSLVASQVLVNYFFWQSHTHTPNLIESNKNIWRNQKTTTTDISISKSWWSMNESLECFFDSVYVKFRLWSKEL